MGSRELFSSITAGCHEEDFLVDSEVRWREGERKYERRERVKGRMGEEGG